MKQFRVVYDVDAKKADILAKADMPTEGLGISEDGVTDNAIPFDQISSAEQLKVSLAITMAANPKVRIIRIMDGNLLDSDNFAVIYDLAEEDPGEMPALRHIEAEVGNASYPAAVS